MVLCNDTRSHSLTQTQITYLNSVVMPDEDNGESDDSDDSDDNGESEGEGPNNESDEQST